MANQINDCKFNFYTNALAKRQAPNFNGVSQRGEVSPIYLNLGDTITVTCGKPTIPNATIIDGFGRAFRIRLEPDGTIRIDGFTGTVNGLPIDNRVTIWPDGISTFELTRSDATVDYFTSIGSRSEADVTYFDGLVYNFKVNDGSVYNFPMDDGWANNPVMRNTGTGADGTFINMTEAAWVEIDA